MEDTSGKMTDFKFLVPENPMPSYKYFPVARRCRPGCPWDHDVHVWTRLERGKQIHHVLHHGLFAMKFDHLPTCPDKSIIPYGFLPERWWIYGFRWNVSACFMRFVGPWKLMVIYSLVSILFFSKRVIFQQAMFDDTGGYIAWSTVISVLTK